MIDLFLHWSNKPFDYSATDCCQFVGACLDRRTGENPAREFLYSDERSAMALIHSYGGLAELLTARFGDSHPDGSDGDIAYVDDLDMVGYVHEDRIVVKTLTGLTDLPMSRASRFWRW